MCHPVQNFGTHCPQFRMNGRPSLTHPVRPHHDVGPHGPGVLRLRRTEVAAERRPRVRLLALHQLSQQEKLK